MNNAYMINSVLNEDELAHSTKSDRLSRAVVELPL